MSGTKRLSRDRVTGLAHRLYAIGRQTYDAWRADRTMRLGAGLAYYALFTIVPFYALSVLIVQWIFTQVEIETYLAEVAESQRVVNADAVAAALTDAIGERSTQTSLGLIGLGSLLLAASVLFLALVDAIETIWAVPVGSGWGNFFRHRLLAFAMVLGLIVVETANLAITSISGAAAAFIPGESAILDDLSELLTHSGSVIALAAAITLLNRFAGPILVAWRPAAVGGIATATALVVGTAVFSFYLQRFGGDSVPTLFSALLALLTWVYVEAQILLGGVQLTKVLANEMDPDQTSSQ